MRVLQKFKKMLLKKFILPKCSRCGNPASVGIIESMIVFGCKKCEIIEYGKEDYEP